MILLLALIVSTTPGYSSDQLGRISGIVLNEDGQPMSHAVVCVEQAGSHKSECNVWTDPSGQFEIQHLSMGATQVFVTKDEDGYSALSQTRSQQTVTLTTQEPTASITIKLAPRAATLIGTVRDSVTGKPVGRLRVMWVATDESGTGSAGTYKGEFHVNLPTTSDLIIFVSAPGYKTWFYTDPAEGMRPTLHLASGEQKSVDIELVPKP
ncbi:MAG: carboxypeptidase-like regulatory domain-containing protein [Candidatus Sulfotelmatobacter sp.]